MADLSTIVGYGSGNSDALRTGILAVFITAIFLSVIHPAFMFTKSGEFRPFGVGEEQTILPFWLSLLMVGSAVFILKTSERKQ